MTENEHDIADAAVAENSSKTLLATVYATAPVDATDASPSAAP